MFPTNSLGETYEVFSEQNWRLFFFRMGALGCVLVLTAFLPAAIYVISTRAVGNITGPINGFFSALTVILIVAVAFVIFAYISSNPIQIVAGQENLSTADTIGRKIAAFLVFIFGIVLFYYGIFIFTIAVTRRFTLGNSLLEQVINLAVMLDIILFQTGSIVAGLGFMLMWISSPSETKGE